MRRLADAPNHGPAGDVRAMPLSGDAAICWIARRFAVRGPHSAARLTCCLIKSVQTWLSGIHSSSPFAACGPPATATGRRSADKSDNRSLCALNRNAAAKRAHTFPAETGQECFPISRSQPRKRTSTSRNTPIFHDYRQNGCRSPQHFLGPCLGGCP